MGLFFTSNAPKGDFKTKAEAKWLEELGCKACPLNATPGKIDATGTSKPEIYILGEAAGAEEEKQRRQFIGKAGQTLRDLLPEGSQRLIRWNNTLNCHPPKNRDPSPQELACCRPRVISDIEKTKPFVIWGFGNFPLKWISGYSGIDMWHGRRMPVKVGSHTCWYYPFYHPSYLNRMARKDSWGEFSSEFERLTYIELERAFRDLDDLPEPVVHTPEMARANVHCITDIAHITKALSWASRQEHVGFDWETNRRRPYAEGAKILSLAVGTFKESYSFPIEHPGSGYSKKQVMEVKELVRRFLLNAGCEKRVHHLAFEQEWAGHFFGIETIRARPWFDTANAAAVIDNRTKKIKSGPLSLEFLCQQHFGISVKGLSDVDRAKLEFTPMETVLSYNGIDSKYHDELGNELLKRIKEEGLEEANHHAQRRVPTVVLSQLKGVPVDQDMVKKLRTKYAGKVKEHEETIVALPIIKRFVKQHGRPFNPASSKDLPFVFDKMLKCPEVWVEVGHGKDKKRKLSTDESVLTEIIKEYDADDEAVLLAQALIKLREASGTKSKYIDALYPGHDKCVIYPDKLIHTNFNTFFTSTGRLSSDDPNLQNFPKRDAETKEVRRSVAAKPGDVVLSFDYGQIEARVIAMFTKDPVFVKALWERFDVHQDWAERLAYAYPARIGGKKILEAWKAKTKDGLKAMGDFRTDIKNQWTFPLFFGASNRSVAANVRLPIEIIDEEIKKFWKMFPDTKDWQDDTQAFYNDNGYVECLTGRRRYGPLTRNELINAPIQGTAAEIVLDAMSRLSEKNDLELQPEINIHDDLTFLRVPEKRVDEIAEKIIDTMLDVPFKWVNVPIAVEMSFGKNWCDLEELRNEKKEKINTYWSDQWEFLNAA